MSTLNFPHTFNAGDDILSSEVNANNQAVAEMVNVTKFNDDNLQDAGISGTKFKSSVADATTIQLSAGVLSVKKTGLTKEVNTLTSATTLTSAYDCVFCNATSAAFTVTLPAAASHSGRVYQIKKTDSTVNAVTIDGNSSETIDGATTTTLNTQYESITIVSNGVNWLITDRTIPSALEAVTLTGGFTTNTTYTAFKRRVGDCLEIDFKAALTGAPDNVAFTLNMPTGHTIDTAKMADTATTRSIGEGTVFDSSASKIYPIRIVYASTSTVSATLINTAGTNAEEGNQVSNSSPMTFATGDFVAGKFIVPISGWKG